MSFILFFALYVLITLFVIVMVKSISEEPEKYQELNAYFNLNPDQTVWVQYVVYASYVYIAIAVLSLLIPVLYPLTHIVFAVEGLLSWAWLIQTAREGKVQIWYNDLKAKFN